MPWPDIFKAAHEMVRREAVSEDAFQAVGKMYQEIIDAEANPSPEKK